MVYEAAACLDRGEPASELASMAKAMGSESYMNVARAAIQLRGGIGFTWEDNTHLWFKRAKSSSIMGTPSYHRDRMLDRESFMNSAEITRAVSSSSMQSLTCLSLINWRTRLLDAGWAAPLWPADWFGRGFNQEQASVVGEVFRERGVVPAASIGPRGLAAETILAHGSGDQTLRDYLTGEHAWCQLFSEPGSSSDLAGLSPKPSVMVMGGALTGRRSGTSAHHADFGILLARTNFDVPKHQGISYFLIDMRQPGVEVRPLKQMNGHASFNEVFMTDAHVPAHDLIGGEGNGWAVAATTLSYGDKDLDEGMVKRGRPVAKGWFIRSTSKDLDRE